MLLPCIPTLNYDMIPITERKPLFSSRERNNWCGVRIGDHNEGYVRFQLKNISKECRFIKKLAKYVIVSCFHIISPIFYDYGQVFARKLSILS